jgi:hypothetical protein
VEASHAWIHLASDSIPAVGVCPGNMEVQREEDRPRTAGLEVSYPKN